MAGKYSKPNVHGRNRDGHYRFSRLDHRIQQSDAYLALSCNAKALLLELISLDNGHNNGDIFLSEKDAAARLGIGCQKTVRTAFVQLQSNGLIAMTKDAHFQVKTGIGRSRKWRLTWLYDYAEKKPASNDWQKYEPPDTRTAARVAKAREAIKRYKGQVGKSTTPLETSKRI